MGVQRWQILTGSIVAITLATYPTAAGLVESDAALKEAMASMASPEERVRLDAVGKLAKTGKPEAAARLVEVFDDISPNVRQAAIRGLESMGPQAGEAVKPLLELFKKEPAYRNQVLKALVSVGADNEEVGKLLLDIAIAKKNNKIIRGADRGFAVASLGHVPAGDRAVPVLIDVAREAARDLDKGFNLYKTALASLEKIGSTKQGVLPALRGFRKGDGLRGVSQHHVQKTRSGG